MKESVEMKVFRVLLIVVCFLMIFTGGCVTPSEKLPEVTVAKPEDVGQLEGTVLWCRGIYTTESQIGYEADWSIHIEDADQWEQLCKQYSLSIDEDDSLSFGGYLILVLFMGERTGSVYEVTELAMQDGMATIGIHEAIPGEINLPELVGCIVCLDQEPLEINAYRDEDAVG